MGPVGCTATAEAEAANKSANLSRVIPVPIPGAILGEVHVLSYGVTTGKTKHLSPLRRLGSPQARDTEAEPPREPLPLG